LDHAFRPWNSITHLSCRRLPKNERISIPMRHGAGLFNLDYTPILVGTQCW